MRLQNAAETILACRKDLTKLPVSDHLVASCKWCLLECLIESYVALPSFTSREGTRTDLMNMDGKIDMLPKYRIGIF